MLVVSHKTKQNVQCYSYEMLFPTLDLYFDNIYNYMMEYEDKIINNNNVFKIIEKYNIKAIWFFRSYYNPGYYEKGNLIMDIDIIKLMRNNIKIFFSCSDLDNISRGGDKLINLINKLIKYSQFYVIDTFLYKNLIKKNIKIDINRYFQVKHFAYDGFFNISFNYNPKNQIILSGAINESYPSRVEYKKYAEENPDKVFVAQRNDETKERKYYHILNEYICGFAGVARGTGFILAKFVEIPATGALLLAYVDDMEELNSLGFFDGINCLVVKNNNFDSITRYILDPQNREKIDEMRLKGRENVMQNHALKHRLQNLEKIFNDLSINIISKKYNK